MIREICVYAPQSRKPDIQKDKFYDKLVHEWGINGKKELTLGIGNFNGHVGKKWINLEVYTGKMKYESKISKVEYCLNLIIKKIYVWRIHGLKRRR